LFPVRPKGYCFGMMPHFSNFPLFAFQLFRQPAITILFFPVNVLKETVVSRPLRARKPYRALTTYCFFNHNWVRNQIRWKPLGLIMAIQTSLFFLVEIFLLIEDKSGPWFRLTCSSVFIGSLGIWRKTFFKPFGSIFPLI